MRVDGQASAKPPSPPAPLPPRKGRGELRIDHPPATRALHHRPAPAAACGPCGFDIPNRPNTILPPETSTPPRPRRTVVGGVAQLVRASDCRSEGCGFEPRHPRLHKRPPAAAFFMPGEGVATDAQRVISSDNRRQRTRRIVRRRAGGDGPTDARSHRLAWTDGYPPGDRISGPTPPPRGWRFHSRDVT